MIADIVLTDDDQGREYHLTVYCKVRSEIGAAPGYCVEIEHVRLDEAVIFFGKQGHEVHFDSGEDRTAAARFIELNYRKQIEELCLDRYLEAIETGAAQ